MAVDGKQEATLKIGILTVSDTCFKKEAQDKSGENLEKLMSSKFKNVVFEKDCVPDDTGMIQAVLKFWCDALHLDLILTTGGTGFTSRDITPEATKTLIDREAPGMVIAMIQKSLEVTPFAMLSRPVSGIRGNTLIINLPGSTKGSQECLEIVAPVLNHAVDQLRGDKVKVSKVHQIVQHRSYGCNHATSKADVVQVARRPRQSTYPLLSVAEAQKMVLEHSASMNTMVIASKDSLGYVLAENVIAVDALPPFPASIKDGYAVIASDGGGRRSVSGDTTAGKEPDSCSVTMGSCVRISTGAAVPPGADAVVQVEDTELVRQSEDGKVELEINILKEPTVGQDIRPIGSDIEKGAVVLEKCTLVGPVELGILAAVGPPAVSVYGKPVVAILSTGNEIVEGTDPGASKGCIRDSNKSSLLGLFKVEDLPTVDVGIARDNPDDTKAKLEKAFQNADVVVSTGGVSMGEKDVLKQVLIADFGAAIHFGRVFMKPGKPTTFATILYNGKKKLVFGLPGNPVSAMVTCHLFVLPAIKQICGYANPMATTIKVKLSCDCQLDPRPEYHRACLLWQEGELIPYAVSTGNQISSRLLSLCKANVLLVFPPRSKELTTLSRGELVNALVIDRI